MSYWNIQRSANAKAHLDASEAQDRIANASPDLTHWRGWLDDYRSRPRPTRFDWRPKLAVDIPAQIAQQPPGDDNGEESKEARQGEEAEGGVREGLGDAPSERSEAGSVDASVPESGDAWWDR